MNEESHGSISEFFAVLRLQQDPAASKAIWERYVPRMIGLARSVLHSNHLALDPQDAVQEAFHHFFRSLEKGGFAQSKNREDLWRILSMLTVQRARKLVSREMTQKRGAGRVKMESQLRGAGSDYFRLDEYFACVNINDWDLHCTELLEQLSDELKSVALMRLAGYANTEIQELLGCSLRSVERRLQLIRVTWNELLSDQ